MHKKVLIITIVFLVLVVTGCDTKSNIGSKILNSKKNMTCTKEITDEDGYTSTETIEITYNDSKVLKAKSTEITETDPNYIEIQLGFGKAFAEAFNEIDGIEVNYSKVDDNKIKLTMEIEYEKIKPEQIKDVLGDLYSEEDSFYKKSDYTIEEFKTENLNDYICE